MARLFSAQSAAGLWAGLHKNYWTGFPENLDGGRVSARIRPRHLFGADLAERMFLPFFKLRQDEVFFIVVAGNLIAFPAFLSLLSCNRLTWVCDSRLWNETFEPKVVIFPVLKLHRSPTSESCNPLCCWREREREGEFCEQSPVKLIHMYIFGAYECRANLMHIRFHRAYVSQWMQLSRVWIMTTTFRMRNTV